MAIAFLPARVRCPLRDKIPVKVKRLNKPVKGCFEMPAHGISVPEKVPENAQKVSKMLKNGQKRPKKCQKWLKNDKNPIK